jgi:hypothetical protein
MPFDRDHVCRHNGEDLEIIDRRLPSDGIDEPEWPEGAELRRACIRMLSVLEAISDHMRRGNRPLPLPWLQVELALGLRASRAENGAARPQNPAPLAAASVRGN